MPQLKQLLCAHSTETEARRQAASSMGEGEGESKDGGQLRGTVGGARVGEGAALAALS